jgi:predicted O-linked N-acetylglucosamine transferase (SPINDLY family)
MNILRSTKDSVLWILLNNRNAAQNLKNEAKLLGVDPNRVIFASNMLNEDHLKRIQLADLFLDTFPYNAHTTASDALRVCLPVLTLEGESFPSRVASSLLRELCITELISKSLSDYEDIAIKIASNPELLQKIKKKLTANLHSTTLFNSKLYAKNLESAYRKIYQRHSENLPPDHVYI